MLNRRGFQPAYCTRSAATPAGFRSLLRWHWWNRLLLKAMSYIVAESANNRQRSCMYLAKALRSRRGDRSTFTQ